MMLWLLIAVVLWRPLAFVAGFLAAVVYVGAFQFVRVLRYLAGY